MNFDNTVYIVIGGTTGMGLSAAKALVSNGAKLVVVGRNDGSCKEAAQVLGENSMVIPGDATLEKTTEKAIKEAHSNFGQ